MKVFALVRIENVCVGMGDYADEIKLATKGLYNTTPLPAFKTRYGAELAIKKLNAPWMHWQVLELELV